MTAFVFWVRLSLLRFRPNYPSGNQRNFREKHVFVGGVARGSTIVFGEQDEPIVPRLRDFCAVFARNFEFTKSPS